MAGSIEDDPRYHSSTSSANSEIIGDDHDDFLALEDPTKVAAAPLGAPTESYRRNLAAAGVMLDEHDQLTVSFRQFPQFQTMYVSGATAANAVTPIPQSLQAVGGVADSLAITPASSANEESSTDIEEHLARAKNRETGDREKTPDTYDLIPPSPPAAARPAGMPTRHDAHEASEQQPASPFAAPSSNSSQKQRPEFDDEALAALEGEEIDGKGDRPVTESGGLTLGTSATGQSATKISPATKEKVK